MSDTDSVVVAVFEKRSGLADAVVDEGVLAANIEQVAHEAVVVTRQEDGGLEITRAKHSVGRSLATLTAKLMVVLPLGFHGLVAAGVAGTQVAAATRDRRHTDVAERDLAFLVEHMEPGASAVLASYPDDKVDAAVHAFGALGAVTVWHAPEAVLLAALAEAGLDQGPKEGPDEGPDDGLNEGLDKGPDLTERP